MTPTGPIPTDAEDIPLWLVFEIEGAYRGAFPVVYIREVLRALTLTPLPGAPELINGVFALGDRWIPVLELRYHLGLEPRALEVDDFLVVLQLSDMWIAVSVGKKVDLQAFHTPHSNAQHPPPWLTGLQHISGIARNDKDEVLLIYDPETFLSGAEHRTLAQALQHLRRR